MMQASVQQPMMQVPVQQPMMQVPAQQPMMQASVQQPMMQVPVQQPMMQVPVQQPMAQAPVPPVPPAYQPFSPVMPAFDVNQIADARLIQTFPLTQEEMYTLEIQHRGAWNMYSNGRYFEAFGAFCKQSLDYSGNYLSAYWAGASALKLSDPQMAVLWFNRALEINPYYQPARKALSDVFNPKKDLKQAPRPVKAKVRRAAKK
jgi:hypothetical protein